MHDANKNRWFLAVYTSGNNKFFYDNFYILIDVFDELHDRVELYLCYLNVKLTEEVLGVFLNWIRTALLI